MVEKLLNADAFLSYFSTLVGIIITVILIPIGMNIYNRKKNSLKKQLAENILMTKINNHLDKLVLDRYKDQSKGNLWIKKKDMKRNIITKILFIPFSIKFDNWEDTEEHYSRKFRSTQSNSFLFKMDSELINTKTELETFFVTYSDVFDKKMIRKFYILDYNIQTRDNNFKEFDEYSYITYAENVMSTIIILDEMRNILLKNHIIYDLKINQNPETESYD